MNMKMTRITLLIGLLLMMGLPAQAAPAAHDLRISQIYGGGGTAGATLKSDFIELFNAGDDAIDLNGWSLQYATAEGVNWAVTELAGASIQPRSYLLVKMASGSGGDDSGTALDQPDVIGTTNLSSRSGKIALAETTADISGSADAAVRDFVGYGSANAFEGSAAAPEFSNTTGVQRKLAGCTDTDDNAADFESAAPAPRNSQSPGNACGPSIRIRDIQSDRHRSPFEEQIVRDVPGIITVVRPGGFYLQDPEPDRRPSTSEAIFVATTDTLGLAPADAVLVSGLVREVRDNWNWDYLSVTQILSPTIELISTGNPLPDPVLLGLGGRIPPTEIIDNDAHGDVEIDGTYNATSDGIDFYESLEHMLVQVNDALVVGGTHSSGFTAVGDFGALATGLAPRGPLVINAGDFNPERIFIDPLFANVPRLNAGDRFTMPISGPLDYKDGNFELQAIALPQPVYFNLPFELAPAATPDQLSVATYNLKNLGADDDPDIFTDFGIAIVDHLDSPDLIALQEVQDNSGAAKDGVTDASFTLGLLIDAIAAAGGPVYDFRQINPVNGADGGQPGGNIRVAFLFRSDRGLEFIDRPGGDADTPTFVVDAGDGPELTLSPGRIDPANPAFSHSRKSLAAEFRFRERKLFVVVNHLNSRLGDTGLFGRFQPPQLHTEAGRIAKAQVINDFVASILNLDPAANVIVLGDFNDFQFAPALQTLAGDDLHNLSFDLPANERYSYIFQGNAQMIDHILASDSLFSAQAAIDVVHLNPEYTEQVQFSDHDPVLARFHLPELTEVLFFPAVQR